MATRRKKKRKAMVSQPLVTNPFEAAKRKSSRVNKPTNADKHSMPPPPSKPVISHTNTLNSILSFDSQTQDSNHNEYNQDSNHSFDGDQSQSWLQYKTMDNSQSMDYLTPMESNHTSSSSQLDIINNRMFNHTKSKLNIAKHTTINRNNETEIEQKDALYTKQEYISRKDLKIPNTNEYLDTNEIIDIASYKKEQKGIVLADRYHLHYDEINVLGNGSFGKVYKVRNRSDGCLYAIKKIKMQSIHQRNNVKYMKEGMILSALQRNGCLCSNIIMYYSMWMQNSYFYLVTELCDNGNSYNLRNNMQLNEDICCTFMQNISAALQYIHNQGYVHFDVKPENIFIAKDCSFKLGDFGLCTKIMSNENKENINYIPKFDEGDSRYLSRELIEESYKIAELDKIDIFALGLSVYELIINDNLPSNGFKWQQIRNGNLSWNKSQIRVTNNMKQLIHAMIHSNPNERPSSKQLSTFLRKFSDQLLQEKETQIQNLNKKIKILTHKIQHIQVI